MLEPPFLDVSTLSATVGIGELVGLQAALECRFGAHAVVKGCTFMSLHSFVLCIGPKC